MRSIISVWATLKTYAVSRFPASPILQSAVSLFHAEQIWDLEFLDQWVRQHAEDAKALGKPLLVEEFGKQVMLEYIDSVSLEAFCH